MDEYIPLLPVDTLERILGKVNPLQHDPYSIRETCRKIKHVYDTQNPWRLLCVAFFPSGHIPHPSSTLRDRQCFASLMRERVLADFRSTLPSNKRSALDAASPFMQAFQDLDLSGTSFYSVPSQTRCIRTLRSLNLSCCASLRSLGEDIGELRFLTSLNLSRCKSLRSLGEAIGGLTSLTNLNVSFTAIEELSGGICLCTALQKLDVDGCSQLVSLPDLSATPGLMVEGVPTWLFEWELGGRKAYVMMADGFPSQPKTLDFNGFEGSTLPEGLSKLINLDEQSMQGILAVCKGMEKLPNDLFEHPYFSTMVKLDLSSWKLRSLPSIGGCVALKELRCNDCYELRSLGGLGGCTALQTLILYDCRSLTTLGDGFKQLRLTKLVLGNTPLDGAEETYEVLSQIPTLTELDLSYSEITSLAEGIGGCVALKELHCHNCYELQSLGGLGGCTSLQTLILERCTSLTTLGGGLAGCTALQTLILDGCWSLTTLGGGIGGCVALKELHCYQCYKLQSLGGISGCTALQTLSLQACRRLRSLGDGLVQQLKSQGCTIYR